MMYMLRLCTKAWVLESESRSQVISDTEEGNFNSNKYYYSFQKPTCLGDTGMHLENKLDEVL